MPRNFSKNKYRPSKGKVTLRQLAQACVDDANADPVLAEWSDLEIQGKLKTSLYVMIVTNYLSKMFGSRVEQALEGGTLAKPTAKELLIWFWRLTQGEPRIRAWTDEAKDTEVFTEDDWVPENARGFLQPVYKVDAKEFLSGLK